MSTSSTTTSTPSISSNISDMILWNMSCEHVNPKSKSLKDIRRPNGMLKVVSLELSGSRLHLCLICQHNFKNNKPQFWQE